jgi:hypothetical protein
VIQVEEKIKVNISRSVYEILHKDMELFEFYKSNGTLNQNAFYTTLITNFYESYHEQEEKSIKDIRFRIQEAIHLKEQVAIDLSFELAQDLSRSLLLLDDEKYDHAISIKPTKSSKTVMIYIENYLLKHQSLSNFYRMLFTSYARKPQDQRERIIFKQTIQLIEQAIQSKSMVFLTTAKEDRKDEVAPYLIQNSKEELFNYVLGTIQDQPYTFRLSRIKTVSILSKRSVFSDLAISALERMRKAPQYFISHAETEDVIVELTSRGVELFRSIYIHRPTPVEIVDQTYRFQCSHQQIFQYFTRFGHHAYVKSPESLSKQIETYYRIALKHYTKKHQSIIKPV